MGQVAMVTDHGSWQTAWTGGVEYPIGGRPSGLPEENAERARVGYSFPGTEQGAGDAYKTVAKGVRMHCLTAAQSTDLKYCQLQRCAVNGTLTGIYWGSPPNAVPTSPKSIVCLLGMV